MESKIIDGLAAWNSFEKAVQRAVAGSIRLKTMRYHDSPDEIVQYGRLAEDVVQEFELDQDELFCLLESISSITVKLKDSNPSEIVLNVVNIDVNMFRVHNGWDVTLTYSKGAAYFE